MALSTDAAAMPEPAATKPRRWVRDPLRDAFALASVVYVTLIFLGVVGGGPDGYAYWVNRLPEPYSSARYGADAAFYYAPAIAQLLAPFTLLSWPAFHALVVAASLASLWWMLGRWSVPALVFPPVAIELFSANVDLLIAAALVIGFRYPSAWAFALLTKVAPGVGLLWFAIRREWRSLAVAVATTAVIVGVSFALAPDLWFQWLRLLTSNAGMAIPDLAIEIPVLVRLPLAIAVLAWGAWTNRRWTVPIGATLALPILWPAQLSLLVACVPLARVRGVAGDRSIVAAR